MARSRRNYTNDEAKTTLRSWLQKNKHTPGSFWHWLDQRGVVVTRQTCHNLFHGHYVAPGPQFKKVFKEITGIVLVDGLIESKGAGEVFMGVIGKDVYTICSDCAKANGATWPEGHCATSCESKCQVCGQERVTYDISDWNWSKGKRPATFSIERRD